MIDEKEVFQQILDKFQGPYNEISLGLPASQDRQIPSAEYMEKLLELISVNPINSLGAEEPKEISEESSGIKIPEPKFSVLMLSALLFSFSSNPSFDRLSNPAAHDLNILVVEWVRKYIGLDKTFSIWDRETPEGTNRGMGRLAPNRNEILLLCFHSTVYQRVAEVLAELKSEKIKSDTNCSANSEQSWQGLLNLGEEDEDGLTAEIESRLVVYGLDGSRDTQRPFIMRNCMNLRKANYNEEGDLDITALENQLLKDTKSGLIPHFLVYTVKNVKALTEASSGNTEFETLKNLASKYQLKVLVDLSCPTISKVPLYENHCSIYNSLDFVVLDLTPYCGMSTFMYFLKDEKNYKTNIANVYQEYLEQKQTVHSDSSTPEKNEKDSAENGSSQKKLTDHNFSVHNYNIGFGNIVGTESVFLFLSSLGKEGLRKIAEMSI